MDPCTPGIAGYDLGSTISPECVDASHSFDFYIHIHGFYWQKAPEVPCKKLHSGLGIQAIWKIIYIVIYSFCSVISYSLLYAWGQSEPCNSLFNYYVEE